MNNFIFKSPRRLIKNSSDRLEHLIDIVLKEQRRQRSDLHEIKRMINRLLVDEHLQQQVDKYFDENPPEDITQPEDKDLD